MGKALAAWLLVAGAVAGPVLAPRARSSSPR